MFLHMLLYLFFVSLCISKCEKYMLGVLLIVYYIVVLYSMNLLQYIRYLQYCELCRQLIESSACREGW